MGLIDTHTHLESFARRGDLPDVLQRAKGAGVETLVAIGTDTDDWSLYRDLAAGAESGAAPSIRYTVGLHPCHVGADWEKRVAEVGSYWRQMPRPVALGEVGLDRFHLPKEADAADRILAWQKEAFAEALRVARELGCPVVVHSRGAFRECVEMVDASGVDWSRVVFHCFTEGPDEMSELIRRGGFGSFTGIITYKNAESVRAAALAQGLGRLMIETDAPYLTPLPHRGKPNEPGYLKHTAEYCAGLFGVTAAELADRTSANARRFFGI